MAILKTDISGDRGALFFLALKTGALTLLTFGIYRFWARTRLRKWYWSAVKPGGTPLEYTGIPVEKLTGFLIALIILAVLLTASNLSGVMAMIDIADAMPVWFTLTMAILPLLTLPLIYFARYRARRYILSRTRWRAIMFGMEPGAIGYAWRATLLSVATVLSLGLLWPVMTFVLERYLTNRTWYGNARFTQHGGFGKLYGPLIPFIIFFWGGSGTLVYAGYVSYSVTGASDFSPAALAAAGWYMLAGFVLLLLAVLFGFYYKIAAMGLLATDKTLGDGVEFDLYPRTRKILKIYFFGFHKTWIASGMVQSAVVGLVFGSIWLTGNFDPAMLISPPPNVLIVVTVMTYLLLRLVYTVFWHTFISYPLIAHLCESAEIHNPELLNTIRQRAEGSRQDAGGFAEALDTGAAF